MAILISSPLTRTGAIEVLEEAFRTIVSTLQCANKDYVNDEHLRDTPRRLARSLVNDQFWGLWDDPRRVLEENHGVFEACSDEMITLANLSFVSFCEHHFLAFSGFASVAYIPRKKMVGLSKIPRMMDILCYRPQVQERLTVQIADCLDEVLQPKGVAVMLDAEHSCMSVRGVKKQGARTRTTALRGAFLSQDATRAEFFASINGRR